MRENSHGIHNTKLFVALALFFAALPCLAQYPGQVTNKPKETPAMRSVAVVEWTGDDLSKAKSSRLIPISVWDGKEFQDGGIFLARPQPMALDPGVEYELLQNGRKTGYFDIDGAGRQQSGWFGQGKWKPLPSAPSAAELVRQRAAVKIDAEDEDSDEPILHRKHPAGESDTPTDSAQTEKAPLPDGDRPTLHRGGDAAGESGSSEPTLHRGGDTGSSSSNAAPDPDRPRLKPTTPAADDDPDRPKLGKKQPQQNSDDLVSSIPSSGDPDRPTLKRGAPAGYGNEVLPTMIGLPPDLKQQLAVSDPKTLKDHPWDYSWANPDDPRAMKEALETEARKALGLLPPPAPAPAPKKPATAAKRKPAPEPPPPPPPAELEDEQFRVFELSYGGGATMVFSAWADVTDASQKSTRKFVTLIAQPDLYGGVSVLAKITTDSAHLDIKPRMRLIDAVDAMGDNRGELVFELRGQAERQFALYRVLRGQAAQVFATEALFFGTQTK